MKLMFALNTLIAIGWAYYVGSSHVIDLLVGFGLGYILLAALSLVRPNNRYHIRIWRIIFLFFYFNWELITSSIRVLWDIITPGQHSKPGFIAMELESKTDLEIFFTANLISLTPGTLSIALSDDRKILYIHAMFIDDIAATIASLKGFEAKIIGAFR